MIRIITDSAADLTARDLETPGVAVVPMSITFADGTAALDDGSMTKDEFFARLAADSKLPRTSQPSPASFIQQFEDAAAAGDEVVVITIAQKLSGTYQCAVLAAAETDAKVYIVDSETATQGEA
ncbi:MAG: DegV family protein, partial [Candidatus Limivicinus sp.]|nr:DegV family protein [Candidatus Limivicinus sp.]